jgi:hypothetical protein
VEFRLVDSIGFSFSKDFFGAHFKKFNFFWARGLKPAGTVGILVVAAVQPQKFESSVPARAVSGTVGHRKGEARIPRSSVFFRFACPTPSVNSVK